MNKLKYLLFAALFGVTACEVTRVIEPEAPTTEDIPAATDMGFNLVSNIALPPNMIAIRVRWNRPISDGRGDPDYYLHSMTVNKAVTGTLPNRKVVNGLADTVLIGRPTVADTLIITSRVWSVRRNLESTSPATGQLVIRTAADGPPPPPDSIRVDTIFLPVAPPIMDGFPGIKIDEFFTSIPVDSNDIRSYRSVFIREEDGTTTVVSKNTTYITLVKN